MGTGHSSLHGTKNSENTGSVPPVENLLFNVFVYRDADSENPGTEGFALQTNERSLDGGAAFRLFAERCEVDGPAVPEAGEGRLFLRHLSAMMTVACMDAPWMSLESWEDLSLALENVRVCKVGDRWQRASVGKALEECLSRAGFSFSLDEVEDLVREGGPG